MAVVVAVVVGIAVAVVGVAVTLELVVDVVGAGGGGGATGSTWNVTVHESVAYRLDTVRSNVEEPAVTGVPLSSPSLLSDNPAGSTEPAARATVGAGQPDVPNRWE